jgi:hypothetical protein
LAGAAVKACPPREKDPFGRPKGPAPASATTSDPHSALLRIGADGPSLSANCPRGRMRRDEGRSDSDPARRTLQLEPSPSVVRNSDGRNSGNRAPMNRSVPRSIGRRLDSSRRPSEWGRELRSTPSRRDASLSRPAEPLAPVPRRPGRRERRSAAPQVHRRRDRGIPALRNPGPWLSAGAVRGMWRE